MATDSQPAPSEYSTITEIRGLRATVETLTAQIEELRGRDSERNNELIGIQSRIGAGAKFKIGNIERFKGDSKKLRSFLTDLTMHHRLERIINDADKTMYAISHLEGDPRTYFEPFVRAFLELGANASGMTRMLFTEYSTFEKMIESAFGNIDMTKEYTQKILELKQTGSVSKVATQFLHMRSYLNWDEETCMQIFEKILKPEVRRGLLYGEKPVNLLGLIDKATQIDNAEYAIRKNLRGTGPLDKGKSQGKDGDVIMTGAVDQKTARKQGLCFFCGKKGHMANKCYKKKREADKGKGKKDSKKEDRVELETTSAAFYMSIAAMDMRIITEESDEESETTEERQEEVTGRPGTNYTPQVMDRTWRLGPIYPTQEDGNRPRGLATHATVNAQEGERTLLGSEHEIQEFEGIQEIEELAQLVNQLNVHEAEERQPTGRRRTLRWPDTSPVEEADETEGRGTPPPPYTERENESLRSESDTNRMTQVPRDRVQQGGRITQGEYRRYRRNERRETRIRNITHCCCAVWEQECYVTSGLTMETHAQNCRICSSWLRTCPQHDEQEKLQNFHTMEQYRIAPWLEHEDIDLQYEDRWRCDLNGENAWYTCYRQQCNVHQRQKIRNRTEPNMPNVLIRNARTCPCLRLGCECQEEDEQHCLHWTMPEEICRSGNRCPTHGNDMAIAAFKDNDGPKNVERIFLQINIAGKSRCAMVDTGAGRSLIGAHVVEGIDELPDTEMNCIDYAGNSTKKKVKLVRGYYLMEERNFQDWFVVQEFNSAELAYDVLLGIDWCQKYDATIRCKTREVAIYTQGQEGQTERISVASVQLEQPHDVEVHRQTKSYDTQEAPTDKRVRFEEPGKESEKSKSAKKRGKRKKNPAKNQEKNPE